MSEVKIISGSATSFLIVLSVSFSWCIAAAALGAEILEFHVVFSRSDFGPDVTSSIEISEITKRIAAIISGL